MPASLRFSLSPLEPPSPTQLQSTLEPIMTSYPSFFLPPHFSTSLPSQ
jgi:hypothetical protein